MGSRRDGVLLHDPGRPIECERHRRQAVRQQVDPEDLGSREWHHQHAGLISKVETVGHHRTAGDQQHLGEIRRKEETEELLDVLVNAAPFLDGPDDRGKVVSNGTRIEREFPLAGLADDADFLGLIRSGGVETLHTLETTLEDVFVHVTGRTLA